MANQHPDTEMTRDLAALPSDLQPLYRRLSDDGNAWQAASARRLASLAQALTDDVERMVLDRSVATEVAPDRSESGRAIEPPAGMLVPPSVRQHRWQWIFGTIAAVVVVTLLALVLQGAFAGRATVGPTKSQTGKWQILDKLTVKSDTVAAQPPVIAPSNPQVVFEATSSISGQGGKAVTFASLRRTEDGGATWKTLKLPLPIANVSTIQIQVSPLSAQIVFMSIWDRSSITCEPTNGTVGEGCERGYVSYNGGGSWRTQLLPVRGILDLSQPIALQQNRMLARNACNDNSCIHLLMSQDGAQTWEVIDNQLTAQVQLVCSFVATPRAGMLYVLTAKNGALSPQPGCGQPASAMTLWRSDDVASQLSASDLGTHWIQLGSLPSISQSSAQLNASYAELLSAPGVGLVYLSVTQWSDSRAPILVSEDYGVTWHPMPTLPIGAESVLQSRAAATMHDGSLVFAINDGRGNTSIYTWQPDDSNSGWTRLPPLPVTASQVGEVIVAPVGSWQNTIIVMLRQSSTSGKTTYTVVRYQM
jgi:hypothetical protein